MGKEIVRELASFTVETSYPDIPDRVKEFAKGLTLKTVAGMIAGSSHKSSRKLSKIIKERQLRADVGVIGCGFKTSLWESVLLNAFFAHASELEDDSFGGGVSWDITVIPLLFPLAQHLRLSGKALLEAICVGMEVHSRTCQFQTEHLGTVVVPGAIGSAAASSRALGLSIEETESAIGMAMSAPHISIVNFGTDAHYFESALQALQGIMSGEMAKEGLTSNPDLGSFIQSLLGKENVKPEKITEKLGKEWLFTNIWIKKYPCCFLNHRQIDIVCELKRKHNISYEDVDRVILHTSPADEPCNRPEPKSIGDLQFSFYHIIGCAILDGDVNFNHIDIDILKNPIYKEARSKVEVIVHPDRSNIIMEAPAQVIIKMKDGREFYGERMYPIGSPNEPLTIDDFNALYSKFTAGILPQEKIKETSEAITNIERLNDIEKLMDLLTFK